MCLWAGAKLKMWYKAVVNKQTSWFGWFGLLGFFLLKSQVLELVLCWMRT